MLVLAARIDRTATIDKCSHKQCLNDVRCVRSDAWRAWGCMCTMNPCMRQQPTLGCLVGHYLVSSVHVQHVHARERMKEEGRISMRYKGATLQCKQYAPLGNTPWVVRQRHHNCPKRSKSQTPISTHTSTTHPQQTRSPCFSSTTKPPSPATPGWSASSRGR